MSSNPSCSPLPPTLRGSQEFCDAAQIKDLDTYGANVLWYLTPDNLTETPQDPNTLISTLILSENYVILYASQVADNCESEGRTPVFITIVAPSKLAPPAIENQTICAGATVADIITDGSKGIVFFDNNDNELSLGSSLNNGTYKAIYRYSSTTTCESADTATFTITLTSGALSAPDIDNQGFCDGATIANIVVPNGQIVWYDDPVDAATDNNRITAGTLLTGKTYYAVQLAGNGCSSNGVKAVAITIDNPAQIDPTVITDTVVCESIYVGQLGPIGYGYVWYDAVTGGGIVPLNRLLTHVGSPHIFWVENSGNDACVSTARKRVEVTVKERVKPIFPNIKTTYCEGEPSNPTTLPTLSGNGISGHWERPLGTTVTTINTSTPTGADPHIYTFIPTPGQCVIPNDLATIEVTVNANVTPTFSFGTTATYCVGATSIIDLSTATTSNNTPTGITGTWSPATIDVSTATSGTPRVYTFTPTAGQCATTATLSVTVNANVTPSFTTHDETVCSNTIETYTVTPSGLNYTWAVTNGIVTAGGNTGGVNTNNTITIEWGTGGTGTIAVTLTGSACLTSNNESINITISTLPIPPTIESPQIFCAYATVSDLKSADNVVWYDVAVGGTPLMSDAALAHHGIYYAAQVSGVCESGRTAMMVLIAPATQLPVPVIADQTLCADATAADIITDGSNGIVFFNPAGIEITNLTTGLETGGEYTAIYRYGTSPNFCESPHSAPFTITLNNGAIITPDIDPQSFCEGATIGNIIVSGSNIVWYDAVDATTPLTTGTVLVSDTYWAAYNFAGACNESARVPVAITIGDVSNIPAPITNSPYNFCSTALLGYLDVLGYGTTWYATATSTDPLPLTYVLPFGFSSYWAEVQGNRGCASTSRVEVEVTTYPNATPTVAIDPAIPTVCTGTPVTFTAIATATGATPNYLWKVNGVTVQTGTSNTYTYTPNDGDEVTVTLTSDEPCANPVSVTSSAVTVSVLTYPAAPVIVVNPILAHPGVPVDLMTAVQEISGMTYIFYENDDKTGEISGTIITYTPPKNTYYVAADNGYCEGPVSEITLKIHCDEFAYDDEGNEYKITPLAGLCWTENLRTKIAPCTGDSIEFARPYICAGCPDNLEDTFGLLYTWHSAFCEEEDTAPGDQRRGICPEGYHIPTVAEWSALQQFTASQLKSKEHWIAPLGPGTDEFGFNVLPAGWYNGNTFRYQDLYGFAGWWARDAEDSTTATSVFMSYYCDSILMETITKHNALSVRCIMDY